MHGLPHAWLYNGRMTWRQTQTPEVRDPDDPYFGLRMAVVEQVNRDRAAAGLGPVEYDALCSDVEDAHCQEMAEAQYLSHWNQRGELPYHRYHAAGGRDYVAENLDRLAHDHHLARSQPYPY
ncbi:MAG: CAP domain-containing protein [Acidobacteria bacterium]|nr:CAP domain-containing protein [Acidobacteriota bacterium]